MFLATAWRHHRSWTRRNLNCCSQLGDFSRRCMVNKVEVSEEEKKHPFETQVPEKQEEIYKQWIHLTLSLDRKFIDIKSPPPASPAFQRAVKVARKNIARLLRLRYTGASVSLFGTFRLGLVQRGNVIDFALHIPRLQRLQAECSRGTITEAYYTSVVKRKLFQTMDVLHRRTDNVVNLKAFARAATPYLIGTYCHEGTFVHFELHLCGDDVNKNTYLLHRFIQLDIRVRQLMQLVLGWSHSIRYKHGSTTIGPYDYLTMATHYLVSIGFVTDLSVIGDRPSQQQDKQYYDVGKKKLLSRPSLHHLSASALLYGFFDYYTDFPWSDRVIGLSRRGDVRQPVPAAGEESSYCNILQIQDFYDKSRCCIHDAEMMRVSIEENSAYWKSLILKREPSQTDRLWLSNPSSMIEE